MQIRQLVGKSAVDVPEVDKAALRNGLTELTQLDDFQAGDKVTTLQKSLSGEIIRINLDGGIVWKCDQTGAVMTGTPQSLLPLR
jgi:hypothetical protein